MNKFQLILLIFICLSLLGCVEQANSTIQGNTTSSGKSTPIIQGQVNYNFNK
jgi:hypothetical protein